jgi:starch synthase
LRGVLRRRADRNQLSGILNGIDKSWDPRTCSSLSQKFSAGDWTKRSVNADDLREQFGLAVSRGQLFALVARLVHQKGVDLVIDRAQTIVETGGQIVVTGMGELHFEAALLRAQARFPQSIAVKNGFNDVEARKIFAGSDFTLTPSRFEPCDLSQMYAQRCDRYSWAIGPVALPIPSWMARLASCLTGRRPKASSAAFAAPFQPSA